MADVKDYKYLKSFIFHGEGDISLNYDVSLRKGDIEINKDNLTIDGNGHTIDANGKNRIFTVNGKNVVLKNFIFKNGKAPKGFLANGRGYGGAIRNNGHLELDNCDFIDNVAENDGNDIINNSELKIINCRFSQNDNSNYSILNMGAIELYENEMGLLEPFIDGGKINFISKPEITSDSYNNFRYLDGLIHNGEKKIVLESNIILGKEEIFNEEKKYFEGITVDVDDLIIDGNGHTIDAQGKTRIFECTGKNIVIKNIILKNGYSGQYGGAIKNTGELKITESILQENIACNGGAIHNDKGNLKIIDCEFLYNYSQNNIILNNDSLQIHNTDFKNNKSKYIILNDGDESNLGIFNGKFIENKVEESVLCNSGKSCSIEKTIFENNIANNTMNIINESKLTLIIPRILDKGKTILNEKYILIRESFPELENMIWGKGTVENIGSRIPQGKSFDFGYLDKEIHESNTQEIILNHDITFKDYEIDFYEGGIELEIDNFIINGNGKTIDGSDKSRVFIISGKNITLKNIVFKNGYSHKNYDNPLNNNGGAIKISGDANVKIENCEFINNTSEEDGGAICNTGELTIAKSTLKGNTANNGGGAIKSKKGEVTIIDSPLTGNTANNGGGGAIYNDDNELRITDSSLAENTAENGGAIKSKKGEIIIIDSPLTGNTAMGSGGAIYNDDGELTITDSPLTGNTAEKGGAIKNTGLLIITQSMLRKNTAKSSGGALYNENELRITESILNENRAKSSGGAIYNIRGGFITTQSTLQKNTAKHGGAIYNSGGGLTAIDSISTKNIAKCSRESTKNASSGLTVTQCTLQENNAEIGGGAIYNNWNADLIIHDSIIAGNTAKYGGGAIYNKRHSKLTIAGSIFNKNISQVDGGAIYNDDEKSFSIENCKFKNNKPDDY